MHRFMAAMIIMAAMVAATAAAHGSQALDLQRLRPDVSPFLAAGCVDNDQAKGFVCPPEVLKRFGCADIKLATNLGGVDMPIATCVLAAKGAGKGAAKEEPSVASRGCKLRSSLRYIVYTTKGFKVARSRDEFIRLVAPIDTPAKAASLVLALDPEVSAVVPSGFGEQVQKVRDREFREGSWAASGDGFTVRLFHRELCGCGRHPVLAVDYTVSHAGEIREQGSKVVQENKMDVCVD